MKMKELFDRGEFVVSAEAKNGGLAFIFSNSSFPHSATSNQ